MFSRKKVRIIAIVLAAVAAISGVCAYDALFGRNLPPVVRTGWLDTDCF
jgi:hypothetical protein